MSHRTERRRAAGFAGVAVFERVVVTQEPLEVDRGLSGEQLQLQQAGTAALAARPRPRYLSSAIAPSACAWRQVAFDAVRVGVGPSAARPA